MSRAGLFTTTLMLVGLLGGEVAAQTLRNSSPPSELPPAGFTGSQFVDSRGCVYVRAGIGGATNWVPRVSRDRRHLCGFAPTDTGGATAQVSTPTNVPNPLDTQVAGLAPRTAPTPEPVQPTPAATTRPLPTSTANAINPLAGAAPVAAALTPQVVRQPAPAPTTAPEQRTITRAQACEGRSGIQRNMISSRTGQPIDCGPGPQQVAVATPVAPTAPTVAATPARMTRTEICNDASGRSFINAATGVSVRCGPQSEPIVPRSSTVAAAQPTVSVARPAPYSNPLEAPAGTVSTQAPAASPPLTYGTPATSGGLCDHGQLDGYTIRCGPQTQSPSGYSDQISSRSQAQRNTGWGWDLFNQDPPPYSNPAYAPQNITPNPPSGYQLAWDDGRLNPNRGLPGTNVVRYATQPIAPQAAAPQAQVSTRSVAPAATVATPRVEAISGQRYVQVGSFASRADAQNVAQRLRAMGLPMRIGVYDQNGAQMRIVLAGPFGSATQLERALSTARSAGYSGAFSRN